MKTFYLSFETSNIYKTIYIHAYNHMRLWKYAMSQKRVLNNERFSYSLAHITSNIYLHEDRMQMCFKLYLLDYS